MTQERPEAGDTYLHFKGNKYQIFGIATHTETGEELVLYSPINNKGILEDKKIFARPLQMFTEEIEVENKKIPRFKFIPRS